jgi:hypothetical protein
MNHRSHWKELVKELKEQMQLGPVEILSGPCAGLVVKDNASLLEYSKRLDAWMFPIPLCRYVIPCASRPSSLTLY